MQPGPNSRQGRRAGEQDPCLTEARAPAHLLHELHLYDVKVVGKQGGQNARDEAAAWREWQ